MWGAAVCYDYYSPANPSSPQFKDRPVMLQLELDYEAVLDVIAGKSK